MKCRHDGNITIGEIAHEEISWCLSNGKITGYTSNAGPIEETIVVTCLDCDYSRSFNRYAPSLPKWVDGALTRIKECANEDFEDLERQERVSK